MTSEADSQALSLAKLIYETTGKIVQQYNAAGRSVPSLDSTDPGPFDTHQAGLIPADLTRNIRIIEGACAQLSIAVSRPSRVINNKSYAFMEPACLRVVYEAKIVDHLLGSPDGMHVNELAIKSGLDAKKLGRILRLLATTHCFREVRPDVFANNRISLQLSSNSSVSSYVGFLLDECFTMGCYLSNTISHPELASSLSPDHAAFRKAFGSNFFDFYAMPENTKRSERFNNGMIGIAEAVGKFSITEAIPWGSAPAGATICDFAGGNGHITLGLAKTFPNLHIILQDLPAVVQQAKEYWNEKLPEAVQAERVQFIEFDFFKDTPAPKCKWYLIRRILHDWPDAECVKILSNIRKATSPDSRLFINEYVLQHVTQPSGIQQDTDQAPKPLLSNYGLGNIELYQQDILMMGLLNSQERQLEEFISLAQRAGFKYEKFHDTGEEKIMEFSPI